MIKINCMNIRTLYDFIANHSCSLYIVLRTCFMSGVTIAAYVRSYTEELILLQLLNEVYFNTISVFKQLD